MDTVAVGDVHGRADLLERLPEYIYVNLPHVRVVFLGDVIDRGPYSRKALDLVEHELSRQPASVLIQGNHEDLMLRFLDRGSELSRGWHYNGGDATVASYGYDGYEYTGPDGFGRFRDELAVKFLEEHPSHVAMLRNALPCYQTADYFFVHAGIDPDVPLDEQDRYLMRWDSKPLIAHTGRLPKIVAHGHTITESHQPELYESHINLDTGAYMSNKLTALLLPMGDPRPTFIVSSGSKDKAYSVREAEPLVPFRRAKR
ncbi:serine/threonine protein phosphatase [Ensifer sp. IC3342]|nr:serine/threonine protein phosphatase [Ensifer sp. BRP08]MCA1450912.1 serine/threonine protein phosphatase [Ensifer sp. IC3342]